MCLSCAGACSGDSSDAAPPTAVPGTAIAPSTAAPSTTGTAATSTTAPAAATKQLILLQQTPPSVADVVGGAARLDGLPFDGIVVHSQWSEDVMSGQPVDAVKLRQELEPLTGVHFSRLTSNYVIAYAAPAGHFADYATVADNFGALAAAARDAGLAGIFFDVEEYFGDTWDPDVACRDDDLDRCAQDARDAGRLVMSRIAAAWPDAQVLTTFGPSLSEPLTHDALNPPIQIDLSRHYPVYGDFAVGMIEGTIGTSVRYIDGGELYTQNTSDDVARAVAWFDRGIAERSPLVPDELRPSYPSLVSASLGVYDFPSQFHGKGPSSAYQWANDIAITMQGVEQVAWAYSERYNWLGSSRATGVPPVPDDWLQATQVAWEAGKR